MIIRDERIVAAGALLPLAETSIHTERFGTRHRAALGITEQTDAVVVVVSEENGQISLVERARIVRNLTEAGLARAIQGLLDPAGGRRGAFGWRSANQRRGLDGRSPRLRELGRFVGRPPGRERFAGDGHRGTGGRGSGGAPSGASDGRDAAAATPLPSPATPPPPTRSAAKPSPPPGPPVDEVTRSSRPWPPGRRGEADPRHHRP